MEWQDEGLSGVALHPGHHGTHHRQVDLVIPAVQHLISVRQHGLAMRAGGGFRRYRLVGMADQRTAAAFAAEAASARSDALGLLRLIGLLTLRRRQAGIVRRLAGFGEPRFKFDNAPFGRLKALPQRPDQGVLLGVAQVVEVGRLRHVATETNMAVMVSSILSGQSMREQIIPHHAA
jgi:hypothetical protein